MVALDVALIPADFARQTIDDARTPRPSDDLPSLRFQPVAARSIVFSIPFGSWTQPWWLGLVATTFPKVRKAAGAILVGHETIVGDPLTGR